MPTAAATQAGAGRGNLGAQGDGLPLREGQPELGNWKEDRSKGREKHGSGTWDQSNTHLLTSKKFPIRHSTEGTVEAMEM